MTKAQLLDILNQAIRENDTPEIIAEAVRLALQAILGDP